MIICYIFLWYIDIIHMICFIYSWSMIWIWFSLTIWSSFMTRHVQRQLRKWQLPLQRHCSSIWWLHELPKCFLKRRRFAFCVCWARNPRCFLKWWGRKVRMVGSPSYFTQSSMLWWIVSFSETTLGEQIWIASPNDGVYGEKVRILESDLPCVTDVTSCV